MSCKYSVTVVWLSVQLHADELVVHICKEHLISQPNNMLLVLVWHFSALRSRRGAETPIGNFSLAISRSSRNFRKQTNLLCVRRGERWETTQRLRQRIPLGRTEQLLRITKQAKIQKRRTNNPNRQVMRVRPSLHASIPKRAILLYPLNQPPARNNAMTMIARSLSPLPARVLTRKRKLMR